LTNYLPNKLGAKVKRTMIKLHCTWKILCQPNGITRSNFQKAMLVV